ncbi:MAG: protein kinase [Gemmatimonadetes bacterium]|nr:protein kinase [Gemmatimonadota bacterium]
MFDDDGKTQPAFTPEAGRTVNQYRILAKIGAGGMGEVYLAEDTKLDRSVALKFLPLSLAVDPTLRARFTREAKAVASLHHPNIVHVYEVGEHRKRPYIAMEHVDGAPLQDILAKGPIALPTALAYLEALAGAVEEAHRSGVVHRDIKPGNIVVDSSDRPKLLDFGLAVLPRDEAITKTGTTLGTVGYMAPEQARGEAVDQRSDLFSLGVVLYEMVTGQQPFRAETEVATLERVLHREQDPLARFRAEVPAGVEQIVAKLLQKDPALRYQTAADLAADIKRERRSSEGSIHSAAMSAAGAPDVSGDSATPAKKRPAWIVPAALLGALAIAAFVFKPWDRVPAPIVSEADASQGRLVILDFQNLGGVEGNENLGTIVSSLLVTDLSESHFLQIVSRQRLFEVARSLGHDPDSPIDHGLSEEIARKVGGRWMLSGTILQTEPNLVLTSQISDVGSGSVASSQRVTGEAGEGVFTVVDKLTRAVKSDLALPSGADSEDDPAVALITTNSPEAYNHFIKGRDYFSRFFKAEATEEFERAIEIDSTFAAAYLLLSVVKNSERRTEEASEYLRHAVRHIDKASWRERLLIQSSVLEQRGQMDSALTKLLEITDRTPDDPDAWYILAVTAGRGHPNFIKWNRRAIEADSSLAPAYNQLAYAYMEDERFEEANEMIRRYIALQPGDPNPYDSQGDIFAAQGKLEEAKAAYQKAYEIKPDFLYFSRYKLGVINVLLGDDDEALRLFRELADGDDAEERSIGRRGVIETHLYRGRFEAAEEMLLTEIADAEASDRYRVLLLRNQTLAYLYSVLDQHEKALEAIERATALFEEHSLGDFEWVHEAATWIACRADREDIAEREIRKLEDIEERRVGDAESFPTNLYAARANLAMERGQDDEVVRWTRLVLDRFADTFSLYYHGRALRLAGQTSQAIDVLTRCDRFVNEEILTAFPLNSFGTYELGLAYEDADRRDDAIAAYEKFLGIWRDAEYETAEMKDAAARLAVLKPGS